MSQLAEIRPPRFDWIERSPDGTLTAFTEIPLAPGVMRRLMDELFVQHWSRIVVGPCVQGAVFEIRFVEPPKLHYLDGYLTVDLGAWHFHLCVEEHRGSRSEELRRMRPVAKAAFWERRPAPDQRWAGCVERSWGLRLWNGYGEQMTTIFLPNVSLSDELKILKQPDWSRLELYYHLRAQFLNEPIPESFEETAKLPLVAPERQVTS
ncbi:MAG: hypothetical protein NZV14_05785 [Bryobacteraceae bacterium]|nr:hypothetical protein [Bryobacteraceae bacterium]MDW8377650.1 hypothetical protein [Bryobacterales bacterium]